MNIFDIITIICLVLLIILLVVSLILGKLYPESHPKYSTVSFILSVFVTCIESVLFTNWLIEVVLI